MGGLKELIIFIVKWFAFAIWGVTVIDVVPWISSEGFTALEIFDNLNNTVTFLTAFFGLVFFLAKAIVFLFVELPHKKKRQKLERDIMSEDLIQKRYDNKGHVDEIAKKKVIDLDYGKTVIHDFFSYLVA
jgi:hypothetical protein